MSLYPLILAIVLGLPAAGFARFVDRGEYIEVSKGVKLCSNSILDAKSGILDPEKRFWRVTSKPRANGTQTVSAFVLESAYDRKSGETTVQARLYEDNYAMRFKRAFGHKDMLVMISPQDGHVEATVEICTNIK